MTPFIMAYRFFRNPVIVYDEVMKMTANKWNVLFCLGVITVATMAFGAPGFIVALLVLAFKGDKREK